MLYQERCLRVGSRDLEGQAMKTWRSPGLWPGAGAGAVPCAGADLLFPSTMSFPLTLSSRGENRTNPILIQHTRVCPLGHLPKYVRVHDTLASSPLAIPLLLAMPVASGRTPGLLVCPYIYKRAGLTVFAG